MCPSILINLAKVYKLKDQMINVGMNKILHGDSKSKKFKTVVIIAEVDIPNTTRR